MLRPEEVEQLVCGCPTLDLRELRKVTLYDVGFKKDDPTIIHFWEVIMPNFKYFPKCTRMDHLFYLLQCLYVLTLLYLYLCNSQVLEDYSVDLQKKFLLFTTGSDRVPVGGMGEMTFKISRLKVKRYLFK